MRNVVSPMQIHPDTDTEQLNGDESVQQESVGNGHCTAETKKNHIKVGRASVLFITWAHTIKQNLAINDNWWQFNLSFYSKVWYFVNQKRTISNRFRFFKLINY